MNELLPNDFVTNFTLDQEEEFNLRHYLSTILHYKWSIIGLTFIVTVIAAIYINTIQPVYRATSKVLIDQNKENVVSIEEVYGLPGSNYEYYQTQIEIIKSRSLAERVIKDYGLDKHKIFAVSQSALESSEPPAGWLDKLKNKVAVIFPDNFFPEEVKPVAQGDVVLDYRINRLLGMLNVNFVTDTQLININFDSYDPNLAANLANALADAYIKSGLESRLKTTQKAAGWITEQLKELKDKVDNSESTLQAYLDSEKLIDAQGVDSIAIRNLDDISTSLVETRRNSNEAAEIYRQVKALKGQPIEAYESVPAVLSDPLVHQAVIQKRSVQQKISELEKRYGPKHPKMIAANAEYETVVRNVAAQINNVVDSLEKQYSTARAEESHLTGALNAAKKEVVSINRMGNELKTLQHEVDTNRQLYDMFLTRFKETKVTEDLEPTNARIIDEAIVPKYPYKPDKQKFVLTFLFAGLILSIILVFIVDAMDNTLKDSGDVENKLMLPVLSILPKLNLWVKKDLKAMRYFSDKNHSGFAENIRTVRTSVLLSEIDKAKKIILVTSTVPEEGKSIVAVNLSLALAQMGKTLLIDADMRQPSIKSVFGLSGKDNGLSHFISGTHELQQCVHFFKNENIYVMPAGATPANPLELLSSNRFKNALDVLRHNYDYIILDSAPAVPVSDPIILSRLSDEVIYVVKADDTPFQLARAGIKKLQKTNANIIGVVLNMVNPSKRPSRYGYGDSNYHSYYGYKS